MELNALKVFESATVDTSIMNFIKQTPPKESGFKYYEPTLNDKDDLKSTPSLLMKQNALQTESFIFANTTLLDLRDKIEKSGTPLKDWGIQINYGIKTGANEAFIIPTEKRDEILKNCDDAQKDEKGMSERERTIELIKPILRGKDIKRYSYEWADLWVINTHNGYTSAFKSKIPPIDIEKYPTIKAHLDSHHDAITTRSDQGDTPYNLRNCAYLEDFEKEKIVWASVGFVEYCMIPGLLILDTNYFFEVSKFGNTKNYLLGLLNSKLLIFWLKLKNTPLGDIGAYRNYKYNIMELPMVKITAKIKKSPIKSPIARSKSYKQKQKTLKPTPKNWKKKLTP